MHNEGPDELSLASTFSKNSLAFDPQSSHRRIMRFPSYFSICKHIIVFLVLQFFILYFDLVFIYGPGNNSVNVISTIVLPCDAKKDELIGQKTGFGTITKPKRILLWTNIYFKDNSWARFLLTSKGHWNQEHICSYNCHFTVNKELLNSSDAVIFHGRDMKAIRLGKGSKTTVDPAIIPSTRLPSQYWILDYLESPDYTSFDLDAVRGFFNLTMTYRADSDIPMPYCRLAKAPSGESRNQTNVVDFLKNKTRMAAWIVSHCRTKSKREEKVIQLQKHISVDVYGGCGNNSYKRCRTRDPFSRTCYRQIGGLYKFYLSFENSLCEDYVTEKFFNALDAGMVPVVYGGADYTRHAPEGSYINVNSFPSIKSLASYLLMLDKNPAEYLKYFEWRKTLIVDNIETLPRGWCNLCERLTTGNLPQKKWITDLKSWWLKRNTNSLLCKKPSIFL